MCKTPCNKVLSNRHRSQQVASEAASHVESKAAKQILAAIVRRVVSRGAPKASMKPKTLGIAPLVSNVNTPARADINIKEQAENSKLFAVDNVVDPRITNIKHFHGSAEFEKLCKSNFQCVKQLSKGIHGDIFEYKWSSGLCDASVAVKQLRNSSLCTLAKLADKDANEKALHTQLRLRFVSSEDAMAEIGVLSFLSKQPDLPLYLLKMQGVFSDPERPLTWLVTEFANGGELFDVAMRGKTEEAKLQDYMWQLLQAVNYLHRHHIGHRDISLENVLMKDGVVRLMDYGMAVRSHSDSGVTFRYFRQVGKDFYRAPECYVPICEKVNVIAPLDAKAGDIRQCKASPHFLCEVRLPATMRPGEPCQADVWGYAATPSDVFALGICMFILAFQLPPWQKASMTNFYFSTLWKDGLDALLRRLNASSALSGDAMELLSSMLQVDPAKRPCTSTCLSSSWLAAMESREIQLHSENVQGCIAGEFS